MARPWHASRRPAAGLLVVPVVVSGLGTRFLGAGWPADLAGGLCYAVLGYVLLVFLRPHAARWSNAAAALAFCVLVELFQLTGLPAGMAQVFPPVRLLLGTTFVPLDLVAYALGVGLSYAIDEGSNRCIHRRSRRRTHQSTAQTR